MKSLRMRPDRSLYFLDLPEPGELGPTEVLVRMAYASICGYDMITLAGRAAYPKNGVLGHEGSGVVIAAGEKVRPSDFQAGDRVALLAFETCGQCDACRSNQSNFCVEPGGQSDFMTEYLVRDQKQLFRLPEDVSLREGCLTEPLMMAMHAVKKARLGYGKSVLILGAGAMGQIILKLVRRHPVGRVVVVEPVASKREAAMRFGADAVVDPGDGSGTMVDVLTANNGACYDAVLEVSGSRESAQMAINLLARGGSLVYFGLYGMDFNLEVNLFNLYWKDATITAVCVPSGYFPAALAMMKSLRLEEVITAEFPFSQGVEAFKEKASGRHAKVMLAFPGAQSLEA